MSKHGCRMPVSFVKTRQEKIRKWQKKDSKAGHGGDFSDPFSELGNESASDDAVSPFDVSFNEECPAWLIAIVESDKDLLRAIATKNASVLSSPHKTRILQAFKNPSIITSRNAEHWIQVRVFYWIETEHPEMYPYSKAIPNGGSRPKKTAAEMAYEGQKPGTPDIDIDYPRGFYHGMKLEVKTEKGSAQQNQKEAISRLNRIGYYSTIEKGYEACIAAPSMYFALPEFDNQTKL
ncbi:hypothetical protein I6Y99_004373 [Vibrio parahaemolyticus]|nr:hypothetical protein [Vibrio parahaemolyticus]